MSNVFCNIPVVASAFVCICTAMSACTPVPSYHTIAGQTMGTSYHITFKSTNQTDPTQLQNLIDERLAQINKSMSTYDDEATIMAFNRAKSGQAVAIDVDFQKVLQDSRTIYQQSGGAFDPTVAPLVNLWGFGKQLTAERLAAPPTQEEIDAVSPLIGLDNVKSNDDAMSIYKMSDGVALDFSAIAKGYAVDVIADILKNHGHRDYMVEIGGEIATSGVNDKGKPWQIAIDTPIASDNSNRQILTTLALDNDHLATSGNYRNSLQWQGVNYSHTINPHTYRPVANGAPSVSVLHDSTALADGWATALTAIPQSDAIALANANNIRALFIIKQQNNWHIIKTQAMQHYKGN